MKIKFGSWGVKLGALVLAVLLWLHAVTEDVYQQEVDIPLLVEDPPAKTSSLGLVVSNQLPSHVRVLASGRGKAFLRLKADDYVMRVQLPEDVEWGQYIQGLRRDHVERLSGPDIQVVEIIKPPDIVIQLDRKARRKVPVEPDISLSIASHYTQVGSVLLEPDSVVISGPRKHVQNISYISTKPFIREDVRADVEEAFALQVPQGMRMDLIPPSVNVSVDIQELAEYPIANVPVKVIGTRGKGVVAEPSRVQVRVKGGADVLNGLDPEKDFTLFVDYRLWQGKEMSIDSVVDDLFEVLEIIPDKVLLEER